MPRRARIPDDLATEIDQRRGDVPFERYVRGLLKIALGEVKAHERDTPPPTVNYHTRETLPRRKRAEADPNYELPKIAPRR